MSSSQPTSAIERIVLVVDRCVDMRVSICEALRQKGVPAVKADSVWAVREALEVARISVVLCSMTLKDGTGYDVIAVANEVFPVVPVVIMSGLPRDEAELIRSGAAGVLYKPFPMSAAIDKVLSFVMNPVGR